MQNIQHFLNSSIIDISYIGIHEMYLAIYCDETRNINAIFSMLGIRLRIIMCILLMNLNVNVVSWKPFSKFTCLRIWFIKLNPQTTVSNKVKDVALSRVCFCGLLKWPFEPFIKNKNIICKFKIITLAYTKFSFTIFCCGFLFLLFIPFKSQHHSSQLV